MQSNEVDKNTYLESIIIKWEREPYGNCPVQATGWIDDRAFYFRSRYKTATITLEDFKSETIYPNPVDVLNEDKLQATEEILKEYKNEYEAGWISEKEAKELIFDFAKKLIQKE